MHNKRPSFRATKVTIKGEDSGLLAGKTVAIKDNVFVAGTPLTNGSKIWEGYTPEFDGTVVTRILQAGNIILEVNCTSYKLCFVALFTELRNKNQIINL